MISLTTDLSLFTSVIFFIIITSDHGGNLAQVQAHVFIYSSCSQQKYDPNTPYETNLNSLLSSIVSSSSRSLYNAFAVGNNSDAPDSDAAYGLYQCRSDLKLPDCAACVSGLINQIELLCPYTDGGELQLDACYVRYEHDDFLGRLDTGLRYEKCSGKKGDGDAEFLRRRDNVLAELGAAAAGYRVSVTGAMEGYAQCLGDLAAADCLACLGAAVEKVKTVCGSAAAGQVFLAQCYVRYWEAGYYDSSSDTSGQDDVGKTVAIIVGVVAGVAILIVLLSFCRKALG